MRTGLMLHCGGFAVDRQRVWDTPTPPRTASFCPIPHAQAVELVCDSLRNSGYTICDEAHGLARGGDRYFGLFEVRGAGVLGDDHNLVVGLRNAHDHAFRWSVAMGSRVFVCDNLAFSGEVEIGRKHTARIEADMPKLAMAAIGQLADIRRMQERRFAEYKRREIANATANDLLVRTIEAGVLPVTKLKTALAEWKAPRHEEFRAAGPTLWRLYNAITEAIKGRAEGIRLATPAIHGIFDGAAGYRPQSQIAAEPANEAQAV